MDKKELMMLPVDETRNLERAMLDIGALKEATENMKKAYAELCESLKNFMKQQGFKKLETKEVIITYKETGTRESFDSKKFKADYPDLYDEYTGITETSDSILVKVRKPEEAE